MEKTPRKILLVQTGEIIDAVLSTPTFRAVKETFPDARLTVLVRKPIASLLEADPCIDEIVEAPNGGPGPSANWRDLLVLGRQLRRAGNDMVIDLDGRNPSAVIARLTGAPSRIGRHEPGQPSWRAWMFTRLIQDPPPSPPPVHPGADRFLRTFREIGIGTKDSTPRLSVSSKVRERVGEMLDSLGLRAGKRWVTLSPFSGGKHKEWAHDRWAEVIGALRERHGLSAIVVGTIGESSAAEGIVRRFGGQGAFHLAGRTTLGELAALLALSTMHLGVDSAPSVIAAAVGVPVVTVYGPSKWKEWTVADATHRAVTADRACLDCGRKGCADKGTSLCLDDLAPDTVLRAADGILSNPGAG